MRPPYIGQLFRSLICHRGHGKYHIGEEKEDGEQGNVSASSALKSNEIAYSSVYNQELVIRGKRGLARR